MIVPFEPPLNDREESFYLELVKVRMKNRELEAAIRDEAEYLWRSRNGEGSRVYRRESDHDEHEERDDD